MRHPVALGALLTCVAAALPITPARAEFDATGTRIAIAGQPARFYMTYGRVADVELYAPVITPLRRANVTFEKVGDNYRVYVRGYRKAEWPIVTSREAIPETGEPCVLELGGQVFVPVRKISELGRLAVNLDRRDNSVALNPLPEGPVAVKPPAGGAPRVALKPASLSAVEIEDKGATLEVRVRTSVAVRPNLLRVAGPPRLVLDFGGARWTDGLVLPNPAGYVKALRTGYPQSDTARLTLEVTGSDLNLTGVRIEADSVTATISRGIQTRQLTVSAEAARQLTERQAVAARNARMALGGRSGDDIPPLIPEGGEGSVIPIPPPEGPEVGVPSRFTPATSLVGRVIVVDAGHGGKSLGAVGLIYQEKNLCLQMARELQRSLEARGATVIMTRNDDTYVSLDDRCAIANQSNAALFISIHCNSMPRRNMQSGSESYWHSSEQSRRLARALHPRLVGTVRGRDGGIRNRSFAVIRETSMPSVLLEIAYINNTTDELLLADTAFHKRLADNLARGVLDYFGRDLN